MYSMYTAFGSIVVHTVTPSHRHTVTQIGRSELLCVESKNETTVSQGVMYEIRFRRLALRMVGRVGVTKTSAFTSVSRSTCGDGANTIKKFLMGCTIIDPNAVYTEVMKYQTHRHLKTHVSHTVC
jgi:hypothetical protein